MGIIEERDFNLRESYEKMISTRENHRPIEKIVEDLKSELCKIKEDSFLIHMMRLLIELEYRTRSPLYTHLQSPMRQTMYLIDLYYSIETRTDIAQMDENCWDRIARLLDEIEITYFVDIGFPNDGDVFRDERDDKVSVSLATFMGYFSNALLIYEEQTLERIHQDLEPYDQYIQSRFGFKIHDALKFVMHIRNLNNNKLNDIVAKGAQTYSFYATHPEEWKRLIHSYSEKGIHDPGDWLNEPELRGLLDTMTTNPGDVHVHEAKELYVEDVPMQTIRNILDFFSYDKNFLKGQTIYYADKRYSESHPIIQMGEKYVCPISKFLLEGLYYRLDEVLMREDSSGKYKRKKDAAFEKKVVDVFRSFFPKKTKIFVNYSVDGIAENDLLLVLGNVCVIVEIKNCNFREPFRDPIKAYERIKKDYKSAIQLGYDQCRRVEKILQSGQEVDIVDGDNKKHILYHLKKRNIGSIWSIVVTNYKYGVIQTDLGKLLKKDDGALYPWSVCIDDLESFFLLMRKLLKGIAPARFFEFLNYRERLQNHVLCFDELEICGWYLSSREQFKECAEQDAVINTTPAMGAIFDAYYYVGLGFKNELDLEYKKHYKMPSYPMHFEMNLITGASMMKK